MQNSISNTIKEDSILLCVKLICQTAWTKDEQTMPHGATKILFKATYICTWLSHLRMELGNYKIVQIMILPLKFNLTSIGLKIVSTRFSLVGFPDDDPNFYHIIQILSCFYQMLNIYIMLSNYCNVLKTNSNFMWQSLNKTEYSLTLLLISSISCPVQVKTMLTEFIFI